MTTKLTYEDAHDLASRWIRIDNKVCQIEEDALGRTFLDEDQQDAHEARIDALWLKQSEIEKQLLAAAGIEWKDVIFIAETFRLNEDERIRALADIACGQSTLVTSSLLAVLPSSLVAP